MEKQINMRWLFFIFVALSVSIYLSKNMFCKNYVAIIVYILCIFVLFYFCFKHQINNFFVKKKDIPIADKPASRIPKIKSNACYKLCLAQFSKETKYMTTFSFKTEKKRKKYSKITIKKTAHIVTNKESTKRFIILLLAFLMGTVFCLAEINSFSAKTFSEECVVCGFVNEEKNGNIYLSNTTINGKNAKNIQIKTSSENTIQIGDKICFQAKLTNVSIIEDNYFNSYFYRNNIYYTCKVNASDFIVVGKNASLSIAFKNSIKEKIYSTMNGSGAEIAYSVIFGDTCDVDINILSAYKSTGIMHIIAVSGLHITLLSTLLYIILKLLNINNGIAFVITTAILIIYCYLCNFTPSALRSMLMFVILFAGEVLFCGKSDFLTRIGLSGILIILFKPLFVLDIGFQLSYLCVISIVFLYKPVLKYLTKITVKNKSKAEHNNKSVLPYWLRCSFALSIATQLGILPVIIANFGEVPIFTVLINVIAVPVFEISYILTLVFLPLLYIFSFLNFVMLIPQVLYDTVTSISLYLSSIPFSVLQISNNNICARFYYYFYIFINSKYCNQPQLEKKKQTVAGLIITLFIIGFSYIFLIN